MWWVISFIWVHLKICRDNETKVVRIVTSPHTDKLQSNWGFRLTDENLFKASSIIWGKNILKHKD